MSLSSFATWLRLPRWHAGRRLLRVAAALTVLLWSLAVMAWLTLYWGILPRLDEWRPQVQAYASRALGVAVQIGQIRARSSGWVPAFELDDVVLRDRVGREALRLPRVVAALSVPSLLALHLRFEQLYIEGARLEVRRDAAGRIHIGGLDVAEGGEAEGRAMADWFFEQHEFVIRDGTLRWVDEQRAAPPLRLTEVQLVARNRLYRHELRLDATPPPAWGQRFTLLATARQPLLAAAGDWQRWKGSFHAELPLADVSELRRHVDLPFEITRGSGALRAWVDWDQGVARALTLDAALRDVSVRLADELEPLAFAEFDTRLVAERNADGVQLQLQHLTFTSDEGWRWPRANLALRWRQPQALRAGDAPATKPATGGEFSADRLDLALMAALAERLPIGRSLRRLLAELDPVGRIEQLVASWEGPLDAPQHYKVRATVRGMAIAAAPAAAVDSPGRPGWRGADLEIKATEAGGESSLVVNRGALEFPGVFERPVVPLNRFSAELQWRIDAGAAADGAPRVELKVQAAQFENDDVQGRLDASWHTGPAAGFGKGARFPGVLELDGQLSGGRATGVARYLPLGIADSTRHWVRNAVQDGAVGTTSFRVKGDLSDFPFVNRRDGEFRIAGHVTDVTLAYVPSQPATALASAWASPWPAFSGVSADLVFDRNAMQILNARGQLWGLELVDVNGGIRVLSPNSLLEIDGHVRGPLADLLRYSASTPVDEWTEGLLAHASGSGAAELRLALNLPLARLADSMVKGSLLLQGGDVRLQPGTPLLAAARGRIDFTHKGFSVAGASARVFGGDVVIDGGSQADGALRFTASGLASADGLRRSTELGPGVARLAAHLQGQAAYRLQLGVVRGQTEINLTSPLVGLAIDLPAPLRKAADAALPLHLQTSLLPESRTAGAAPRDQLQLELGQALQASYLRELSGPEPRVLRGAVALNAALPEMQPGVRAVAELAQFDADAWQALLQPPRGQGAAAVPGDALDPGYLPQSVSLKAQALRVADRRLTRVSLELDRRGGAGDEAWQARVEAEQVSGTIDYREAQGAATAATVKARLTRLSLPPSEADEVVVLLDKAPASVPSLDIVVDDFELRGHKFGRLAVEASNRPVRGLDGSRGEWRLTRLALSAPDSQLLASGQWALQPGSPARRMALDFKLDIADAGALLLRLGFGNVVRGGKGQLAGQVGWTGSPLSLDLPTLDGRMALALDSGQFLKADAGAARLLGVLSLQSLPRRLALDFRDVFQEGFAFDNVSGDITLEHGVASTNNLRMRGVQAAVLMEGGADIARETQDLHMVVVPEINAGTASLAFAAINPAIGLGTFFGQWLLRGPLQEANTREFRITGPWADPQVTRLERNAGGSGAAAQRPAAASAPAAPP